MIQGSAYVHSNRLCIMGVCHSTLGPVPFAHAVDLGAEVPNGPVNMRDMVAPVAKAFEEAQPEIISKIKGSAIELAAADVVQRARQGDQNAMAVLTMVTDAAKGGDERAKVSYKALRSYAEKHPVSKTVNFGIEKQAPVTKMLSEATKTEHENHYSSAVAGLGGLVAKNSPGCMIVILADGPSLLGQTNPRVEGILVGLPNDEMRSACLFGLQSPGLTGGACRDNPHLSDAYMMGYCLGIARRMQAVKNGAPISALSPSAGWELGE